MFLGNNLYQPILFKCKDLMSLKVQLVHKHLDFFPEYIGHTVLFYKGISTWRAIIIGQFTENDQMRHMGEKAMKPILQKKGSGNSIVSDTKTDTR